MYNDRSSRDAKTNGHLDDLQSNAVIHRLIYMKTDPTAEISVPTNSNEIVTLQRYQIMHQGYIPCTENTFIKMLPRAVLLYDYKFIYEPWQYPCYKFLTSTT